MALRLVFQREDIQRVRLSTTPDPLWELVLSMHCVQARRVSVSHATWYQAVHERLAHTDPSWRRHFGMLRDLVPPSGDFPDFLTPAPTTTDLDAGCEALAYVSPTELKANIAATFVGRGVPAWVRALATGDRQMLDDLLIAVRRCFGVLVDPHWSRVADTVAGDRAGRVRVLSENGLGTLLTGLPGVLGWDGEVLVVRYPRNRTVFLNGRGLTLVPSYFCSGAPVTLIDPELPPVLVYPADRQEGSAALSIQVPASLIPLLSRTRAECLHILRESHTTSQLGHAMGLSVGSASKQTTVLRRAGLITSTRTGNAVVHRVTALGTALLNGDLLSNTRW
jgi:DNA-binding transcriptional ArsR family regulator